MARQARHTEGERGERIEVITAGEPEMGVIPTTHEPSLVGDATRRNPPPPASAATAHRYLVTRGGYLSTPGGRSRINEGKVVDDLNYDIAQLKQQGIGLELIAE